MTLMFNETYQTSKCMDNADLTVSNLMEYFISIKRIDPYPKSVGTARGIRPRMSIEGLL